MRQLIQVLFCVSFILFSCGKQQQSETSGKQDSLSRDVITAQVADERRYRPVDKDTLVSKTALSLQGEPYSLKMIRYCNNDSAVVNELWLNREGTDRALDIAHNYFERVILTKGNNVIFDTRISKDALKARLEERDYRRLMLYDIEYDYAKENRLYLKATLVTPDTNQIEEVGFAVFYQTEKAGQLDFPEVRQDRMAMDDLRIYDLRYGEMHINEKAGFVSLSDSYPLSEHPDSLAIPGLYSLENDESVEEDESAGDDPVKADEPEKSDEYFTLESKYRERFLAKTKISETDNVFIYNYYKDTLVSFPVKHLKVVACLNPYAGEEDKPYSQYDYMIGFEISKDLLEKLGIHYSSSLVYAGRTNPFVQGQLKPVAWKKIEARDFPFKAMSTKNILQLRKHAKGDAYKYETADFQFFTQDFLKDNSVHARRLLVIDAKTKETVRDVLLLESEGSSLVPLNFTNEYYKTPNQWTGKLFKDRPSVIFGFEGFSFGCPSIAFLSKSGGGVYIRCDNRH